MLTHRNLAANVAQIRPLQGMRSDDRILARAALLPHLRNDGAAQRRTARPRTAGHHAELRPGGVPRQHRRTTNARIAFIAPPVAVALAKHPLVDAYDLSSLRSIMSGAAPLDEELGNAVAARLGCQVVQGYGMSELSPVSHITPFDGGARSHRFDGRAVELVRLDRAERTSARSSPEYGDEIDPPASGLSGTGELWFKGPNVMAGYLGNDEATRETIDDEGFLHTGDVARVDASGCVYIVDRLKELIKYKGYQVPPAELEAVLLTPSWHRRRRRHRRASTPNPVKRCQRRSWSSNPAPS